ncbi:MAG: hypothetical protein M3O70_27415 [Actinomycetota bacterium]|nr:hypothetical protein [Actinomycetota bacterium]
MRNGALQGPFDVLAPDVVLVADGGGLAPAPRPVEGANRVDRILSRFPERAPDAHLAAVSINGAPALRIDLDGEPDTSISLVVDAGQVTHIYIHRNPQSTPGSTN